MSAKSQQPDAGGVGTGGTSRERFAQLHCHRLLRFAATDSRRCATTDSRRCAALPQRSLTPNAHSGTSPAHAEFDVSFACLLFFAGAYCIRPVWTPLWRRSRTFFLEAGLLTEGRPARAVTRTTRRLLAISTPCQQQRISGDSEDRGGL